MDPKGSEWIQMDRVGFRCVPMDPFRAIAQFWNIFMNCSATITRIFKIFGALFLYFEYASFKYHKQNIRSKKYFDFTPYTDFVRAQLLIGRSPRKLKVILKNVSKIQFYIKISSFDKKI